MGKIGLILNREMYAKSQATDRFTAETLLVSLIPQTRQSTGGQNAASNRPVLLSLASCERKDEGAIPTALTSIFRDPG